MQNHIRFMIFLMQFVWRKYFRDLLHLQWNQEIDVKKKFNHEAQIKIEKQSSSR